MDHVESLRNKVLARLAVADTSIVHVTLGSYSDEVRELVKGEIEADGYVLRHYTSHGQDTIDGVGWHIPCDCWVIRPLVP